ncbi:MAG TPA: hypothetical protein PLS50_05265 [Candidatus Dojkabacteria bacterium]|nr:hypothetical protein [Candidatus Dojkabacteria bacterium]
MFVEHNDMYFCNKRCFGVYEKEQALSLVEECSATPVKCPYCNENKPCCKFRIVAGKGIFCDDGKI